ncbi:hypothetical protein BDU57DRAFT_546590 [Ampelomyces quisqualis]|uniref:Uncharacterized protein n=1 Tax=Ampelomyces quisqualis TaxID=50730 RepID=A0A6A5QQY3_AMPQU|nr:hypothetical protein BDU57DRAFT_546590 [Ampelomyces quisqualis]
MGPGGMGPGGMGMGPGGMGMGPGGMGPGGMGPGGIGPRGMMPNAMFPPQDLPPRYSNASMHPPPAGLQAPYNAYPPSPSSTSSAPANPPARPPHRTPANKHVPMGAYAQTSTPSPKGPRARAPASTAERVHRKTPAGGREWIQGDDFLDACLCTTNCTCRAGHRVLYRSRDDGVGSGSDADGRYNMGEIRYVLKKELGRDCGDHSGCRGARRGSSASSDSSTPSGKTSRQAGKKAASKRGDDMRGFKDDMLAALDERFDRFARERARSRAGGSVGSTPRPPFAAPFGLQSPVHGGGVDPLVAQKLGMGMGAAPGHPYAGLPAVPPMGVMNNRHPGIGHPGMGNPGGMHPMRPGPMQMPMGGMPFRDDMSAADMDGMGMGDGYFAGTRRGKGMQARFLSPGSGGMDIDATAYYRGRTGFSGRGGRGRNHPQRPARFAGNDDFDLDMGPSRRPGLAKPNHQDSFDNLAGAHMDDDDGRPQGIGSPRGNAGKKGRGRGPGRHQARIESTDDDGSYKG